MRGYVNEARSERTEADCDAAAKAGIDEAEAVIQQAAGKSTLWFALCEGGFEAANDVLDRLERARPCVVQPT